MLCSVSLPRVCSVQGLLRNVSAMWDFFILLIFLQLYSLCVNISRIYVCVSCSLAVPCLWAHGMCVHVGGCSKLGCCDWEVMSLLSSCLLLLTGQMAGQGHASIFFLNAHARLAKNELVIPIMFVCKDVIAVARKVVEEFCL